MKRYFTILLLSCITLVGYGQTVDELFKTMPDDFLPAFSEADKTMLLVDSSHSVIPYALGEIEKLAYSDSFLSLKTSKVGTMQIKILPLVNNTQIIVLIKTVCSGVCDSDIRFFTTEWEEIDKSNMLPTITPHIFFDESELDSPGFKWAVSQIDIFPLQFQFKDRSNDLQVKFDIANHLSSQDSVKLEPYLAKETINLIWNKSTFVY